MIIISFYVMILPIKIINKFGGIICAFPRLSETKINYPCPMCLSAIIWSNIKKVYYGNTKKDAANIGFRDDFIYNYINKLVDGGNDIDVLNLECIDREETIKSFDEFLEKSDKIIY